MRLFNVLTAIFVISSIIYGSGEIARASTLNMNFVNSKGEPPFFPIPVIKVSESGVRFEYQQKDGATRQVSISLGRDKKWKVKDCLKIYKEIKIAKNETRKSATPRCSAEIEGLLMMGSAYSFPKHGPSAIEITLENPDKRDKDNGNHYNIVIKRGGLRNSVAEEDRQTYDTFEQDPSFRVRFKKEGDFVPSEILKVTKVLDKVSLDAVDTKRVILKRSYVNQDGSFEWSQRVPPNNRLNIYSKTFESAKWPVNENGSLVLPATPAFPFNPNNDIMDAKDQRALSPPSGSSVTPPAAAQ
jgi:hypothetical protein